MELSFFIEALITEGSVSIQGALSSSTADDIDRAKEILLRYYQEDVIEMPAHAPAFSMDAALWAAQYFYQAVQLTVLRDAGEEVIAERLNDFPGTISPGTMYSADLVFRYLPALFSLAKGLAPADVLVHHLRRIAIKWPFSSVGIDLDEAVDDAIIFQNPSLRQEYIDRIIKQKDRKRINSSQAEMYLLETSGEYLPVIWPGFEAELITTTK